MKLVMTLLVRDEEEMIEANLRFHLASGVDFIIITDNGSLDATRRLIGPYVRRGQAQLIDEPGDNYAQSVWVTRMARLAAAEQDADWVMHCDADEFWWSEGLDLKRAFGQVDPAHGVVRVERHEFMPGERDGRPFWARMLLSDTQPRNANGRPLPPKCAHRADPNVIVAQGNHDVESRFMRAPDPLASTILHFPARDFEQFERKIVLGGRAYARNRELPFVIGNTWRSLYRAYLDGTLVEHYRAMAPSSAELAAGVASGRYARDTRLRDALGAIGLSGRSVAGGLRPHHAPAESPSVTLGRGLEERLIAFIDGAQRSIDLAITGLSATGVLAALHDADRRGVRVRLVLRGTMVDETRRTLGRWRLSASFATLTGGDEGLLDSFVLRDDLDV